MTATIINLSIALLLGVYAFRSKDVSSILISLFLYISFHYSYAAIPIFSPSFDPHHCTALHLNTQAGVKLVGSGFLLFTAGLFGWRYRRCLFSMMHSKANKWLGAAFLLWGLIVIIHWIISAVRGVYPSTITLQSLASASLMIILAWSFGSVLHSEVDFSAKSQKKFTWIIFVILSFMVTVALWEMLSLRAWAFFTLESEDILRRASSLHFNPNVFGFWCAVVAVLAAYAYHSKMISGSPCALTLILASFGIFLSGSRTGLIICLFTLGLSSLLLIWPKKSVRKMMAIMPLFIFASGMTTISLLVKSLSNMISCLHEELFALTLLTDRFANMPREITLYANDKLSSFDWFTSIERSSFSKILDNIVPKSVHDFLSESVSKSTAMSIQGRFESPIVDNGYLAMLQDVGWLGLVAWLALWLVLVGMGLQAIRRAPGVRSAYSLSTVLGCALAAVFMRAFQVFPFWVIISLVLGLCIAWFNNVFQRQ